MTTRKILEDQLSDVKISLKFTHFSHSLKRRMLNSKIEKLELDVLLFNIRK